MAWLAGYYFLHLLEGFSALFPRELNFRVGVELLLGDGEGVLRLVQGIDTATVPVLFFNAFAALHLLREVKSTGLFIFLHFRVHFRPDWFTLSANYRSFNSSFACLRRPRFLLNLRGQLIQQVLCLMSFYWCTILVQSRLTGRQLVHWSLGHARCLQTWAPCWHVLALLPILELSLFLAQKLLYTVWLNQDVLVLKNVLLNFSQSRWRFPYFFIPMFFGLKSVNFKLCFSKKLAHIAGCMPEINRVFGCPEPTKVLMIVETWLIFLILLVAVVGFYLVQQDILKFLLGFFLR